jgi:hypothetical protein
MDARTLIGRGLDASQLSAQLLNCRAAMIAEKKPAAASAGIMSISLSSRFSLLSEVLGNKSSPALAAEFLLAVLAAGKRPASLGAAILTEQSRSNERACGEHAEPRRGTWAQGLGRTNGS